MIKTPNSHSQKSYNAQDQLDKAEKAMILILKCEDQKGNNVHGRFKITSPKNSKTINWLKFQTQNSRMHFPQLKKWESTWTLDSKFSRMPLSKTRRPQIKRPIFAKEKITKMLLTCK